MTKTVVLYPALAVSHFVPMMQLADALLDSGYAVEVALMDPALKEDIALSAVVRRVAASKPSVVFHTLPRIEDPPAVIHDAPFILRYVDLVSRYDRHLHGFLRSLAPGSVRAVVVDVASSPGALDVVKDLGIPAYMFYPMNASAIAVFLQLAAEDRRRPSYGELGDTPLELHGVPPVPASHLPREILDDPESEVHKVMMEAWSKARDADGILVNTFASLEARAVEALADPRRVPATPPVYCVGPLVAAGEEKGQHQHECLAWLDEQPERSVVYLCFGSLGAGSLSKEQLREIAVGLENSGHRFLWVVRAPPPPSDDDPFDPRTDPDLDGLLPERFLERTNGRGLVVKLWAPQAAVLRHRATGAFVTHCGWNSALEAVVAGVPMLCWPLHSEQKMNKVFMVEEAGVGAEMAGWQRGLVTAEEVEAKVRMVLDSQDGERLRARVAAHGEAAAAAWKHGGGSSRSTFARFLSAIDDDHRHHVHAGGRKTSGSDVLDF